MRSNRLPFIHLPVWISLVIIFCLAITIFITNKALGLSVQYFYDVTGSSNTACDVGPRGNSGTTYSNNGCSVNRQIVLRTGEANLVPVQTTTVQANFSFPAGPTGTPQLTIRGAHVCIQNPTGINSRDYVKNGYYSYNASVPPNTTRLDTLWGESVVSYQVGPSTGSLRDLPDGLFRRAANPDCDVAGGTGNIVVNLTAADFSPVPGVPGMYYTLFRASHIDNHQPSQVCSKTSNTGTGGPCDGITNSFAVRVSGTGAHSVTTTAQTGSCVSAQSCATLQARDGDNNLSTGNYNTYKVRFGSDCTVPLGGEMAAVNFYDLDYGNTAATTIKVTIHNETDDTWLWNPGTSAGGGDWRNQQPSFGQAYQPPTANSQASRIWFRAQQNNNYVAYIINVNPVLVMQVGTPYDGIYYTQDCANPTSSVTPVATIADSTGELNEGTGFVVAGTTVTAAGRLDNNSGTNDGYVNARWEAWLDGDATPRVFNAADDMFLGSSPARDYDVPANGFSAVGTVSRAALGTYTQVCSRVFNVMPRPSPTATPTVTSVTVSSDITCIPIQRRPFFTVMNGDVNATAAVQPACNVGTSTISAFYAPGSGSTAQIAAYALGTINDFKSAGGAGSGKQLTFANTVVLADPSGGLFGQSYCIPTDYWAGATGDLTIKTEVTDQYTVVTKGDVYITDDLPYDLTFASNAIPYRLIAAQNIYIAADVVRLDGVFAATGTIYTCATGTGTNLQLPNPDTNMASACKKQLTVNGSFIGGLGIKLLRTHDTLGGQPAERFIYSPEVWLQAIQAGNTSGIYGIDSITILPPIL